MTKRFWLIILAFSLTLFPVSCTSPPATARVIEVIDGDTIVIEGGYRVRYIGIDAPEVHPDLEAFGMEAWQANCQLVESKTVRLEKDTSETDRYDRLLRYVWVDNTMVNAEMVRQGMARARAYPPDTRYQNYLEQLEGEARETKRGMWAE